MSHFPGALYIHRLTAVAAPDIHTTQSRRYGLLFATGWLVFLALAGVSELTSHHPLPHKVVTVGAAGVFVVVYLAFWISIYRSGQVRGSWLILLVLCGFATFLGVADFETWGGAFIYCTVVAGFAFDWRRSTAAVLAIAALAATLGLAAGAGLVGRGIDVFIAVLAGLGMVSINRMIVGYRELRLAREDLARLAVAEERLRFARDLHDLLGHSLSVIVLKAELAAKLVPASPERATHEVGDIERVAREALREVREAVSGYRQAGLDQELEGAQRALEAAGVLVRIQQTAGPLPGPVESVLAWAVREGTTNAIRHSRAQRVDISIESDHNEARLEVLDDGVGGSNVQEGSGLRGLRERIEAWHGSIEFGQRPEGGFQVAVSVPLQRLVERAVTT